MSSKLKKSEQCGFTLVEMVVIIVIVGILAVSVAPRFSGMDVFSSRGFYDEVSATIRYAQKAAIAQHRYVCVTFAASSMTLTHGATSACGAGLAGPDGTSPYTVTAPAGVALSGGVNFNFDMQGRPSAAQNIVVSGSAAAVTVEMVTGYVH